ncbi:branched-chain amino acid ABC transporter permease [Nocardioides zeae]|uniref:Branched-chain amino acid ABC transporter permease n=1 Tax=Nocardioides zeae TaxID=1457234 RepID=A0A6P0HN96_9ACTN|nr:branched-chain amino acid ABC transporter permease [Nocardioides zeae]NEN79714.1 branched-chain amino acid ABC transporter permease [Nocardioides zeae]
MTSAKQRLVIVEGSALHLGLRIAGALAIIATAFALPYVLEPFRLSQIAGACVYAMAVVGLNLLAGFGGQISLGHAAFFGLGAYTTGVLTTGYGVDPALSFLVGIVVCFAVGVIVAFPALRLRGIYVALVTLAVGLIFPTLVIRFADLTGGSTGLFGVTYQPPDLAYFSGFNGRVYWNYWLAVAGLALACLVVRNLMNGRFGRSVIALRDNETAAVIMGVNRTGTRVVVFGTSASIAGLAGSLFAVSSGLLTPLSFSLLLTLYFLAGMIIGGASSFWGPVLGGFLIYFVPVWSAELSSINGSQNLAGVVFGVIIILITFFLRSGLAGLVRTLLGLVVRVEPRMPVAVPSAARASLSEPRLTERHHLSAPADDRPELDRSGVGSTDAARNH